MRMAFTICAQSSCCLALSLFTPLVAPTLQGESGAWIEQLLTGGETQYVIPLQSVESQPIYIQVIAVGGNTESAPANIVITPAPLGKKIIKLCGFITLLGDTSLL